MLHSATGGRLHFSTVKILLPRERCSSVNSTSSATAADSYDGADFKITDDQPLAQNLPWTRQYRGCSLGADDIFIPLTNFLLSSNLNEREKAGILLQEWAKFRYGVFDEFGVYNDPLYSPCYQGRGTNASSNFLSSCSSTDLPALFEGQGYNLKLNVTKRYCNLLL